jgi:hypothetical protein
VAPVELGQVINLLFPKRVSGTIGGHECLLQVIELFRVFAQRQHGLLVVFGGGVGAVLQGIHFRVLLSGRSARSGGEPGVVALGGEQLGGKLG